MSAPPAGGADAMAGILMYLMNAGEAGGVRSSRGVTMARLRVKFTYPPERVQEPIIYEVGKRFELVTNIRRADVTAEVAWVILELDGEEEEIARGIKWVTERGIRVDPVEDTIIEG